MNKDSFSDFLQILTCIAMFWLYNKGPNYHGLVIVGFVVLYFFSQYEESGIKSIEVVLSIGGGALFLLVKWGLIRNIPGFANINSGMVGAGLIFVIQLLKWLKK